MQLMFPKRESEMAADSHGTLEPRIHFSLEKACLLEIREGNWRGWGRKGPARVIRSLLQPPGRSETNPFQMVSVPFCGGPPRETPQSLTQQLIPEHPFPGSDHSTPLPRRVSDWSFGCLESSFGETNGENEAQWSCFLAERLKASNKRPKAVCSGKTCGTKV